MEQQEQELTSIEIHEKKVSALLQQIPEDVGVHIVCLQLQDIHNQVNTPEEARDFLVSVSLVNKFCNQFANRPLIIKDIISNLSATLRHGQEYAFHFYEETIAEKLNTPATTKYIEINNQFFADNLKKNDIELLLQQGADPNYRRHLRNVTYKHDLRTDYGERHGCSRSPLFFYMLEETEDNIEIVKCLLDHGSSIFREKELYHAITKNRAQMVAIFLSYNPIFSATDTNNYLQKAIQIKNSDIINLVMKAPIPSHNFISALLTAVNKQDFQLIQELFNHGAKPEMLLKDLVAATVRFPYLLYGSDWYLDTLKTTEVLQLFCKQGIKDQSTLDNALTYAKSAKQRAKEVIAMLQAEKDVDLLEKEEKDYIELTNADLAPAEKIDNV
jgi:hypothetical protein